MHRDPDFNDHSAAIEYRAAVITPPVDPVQTLATGLAALKQNMSEPPQGNSQPFAPMDPAAVIQFVAIHLMETQNRDELLDITDRDDFACFVSNQLEEAAGLLNYQLPAMGDELGAVQEVVWEACRDELIANGGFDPDPDENVCRTCGGPNDDGEGYDGECGECADRTEAAREEADHD